MKKSIAIALASAAIIAIGTTATVMAYAKTDETTTAATTAQTEATTTKDLDGKIIVMRSFFGGYVIDEDDIQAIKTAATKAEANGTANAKDLKEIIKVYEQGQAYEDSVLGCEYRIIRKAGNENVTFELPRQNPKFYNLSEGWDFNTEISYYSLDKLLSNTTEVEGAYGNFDLIG